jgi:hypothetical protein
MRYLETIDLSYRLGIFRPQADHQSEFAESAQSGFSLCIEL